MPRILAIDYGTKRCGIAVTDECNIIATALTVVPANELFPFLSNYFLSNKVSTIVIGMPKNLNNTATHATPFVYKAINALMKKYPSKKIIPIDERFTSTIALQSMISMGSNKKQRAKKGNLDKISATILLQDYLNNIS